MSRPPHSSRLDRNNHEHPDSKKSTEHQHARIMASFIPDEIIYSIDDYSIRKYECVLMLGDVSGFTDLSEKYNKTGKGGPSRLTLILNNYIGSMVQEIMRHNGDLLKFSDSWLESCVYKMEKTLFRFESRTNHMKEITPVRLWVDEISNKVGDAFLAMWKCVGDKSMRDVMSAVLACSLIIQRSYGRYETDVGVTLKVKLGIAAGLGQFSIIGNAKSRHYVILGEPVWDVKLAEHSCNAGEVMLAPSAWRYVNAMEFNHEYHEDGKHVKITGCGESWQEKFKIDEDIVEGTIEEDANSEAQDDTVIVYSERTPKPEAAAYVMSLSGEKLTKDKKPKEFSLRPSVDEAAKQNMKEVIQPFILPVVMRAVDMGEPLDYLTEMRQVVIMFLNIVPYEMNWEPLIGLVNQSYTVVCELVEASYGIVNKVSYFDKDLMMLIIFGLRGYKHELESQIALMSALEVRIACESLEGVKSASIGVTTGMAYCGVVGHVLRREYTVIGVPVNKGARLMVAYPGKVTCDRQVFLHSKLDSLHFVLQEPKQLKGLQNVGPIYEYREIPVLQGITSVSKYPLLGRNEELRMFKAMVDNLSARRINPSNTNVDMKNVFMMKAEPRLGKTRLLDEMLHLVRGQMMVHKISLNTRDQKVPYKTIQLIFTPTLTLPENSSPKDKEEKLIMILKEKKYSKWLCCLNSVFNVNFEYSKEYLASSDEVRTKQFHYVLLELFTLVWVCGIDDCEFMDESSWSLLPLFFDADCVLFAITVGSRRELPQQARDLIVHPRVMFIELTGIDKWYHAGLVCQITDVRAIPAELEKIIQEKSKGNPGWIESFLTSLIQAGGLMTSTISADKVQRLGLVSPPDTMLIRIPDESLLREKSDQRIVEESEDDWKMYQTSYKDSVAELPMMDVLESKKKSINIAVCRLADGFNIEEIDPGDTIDALMLQVYDNLTSFEQLLLKCSSVMGVIFPRSMLLYIMNISELRNIALAVKKLFEIRVICCARGDFTETDNFLLIQKDTLDTCAENGIDCSCKNNKTEDYAADLPKYASCGLMRFRVPLFRDTTYTLLLDKQKKDFHTRAARYIEKETRRCKYCGGGIFTRILRDIKQERRQYKIRDKRMVVDAEGVQDVQDVEDNEEQDVKRPSTEEMMLRKLSSDSTAVTVFGEESRLSLGEFSSEFITADSFHQVKCRLIPLPCFRHEVSSASLTQTFSSLDFSNCECPVILTTMYTFVLEHYRGAGIFDKVMDTVLEFAALTIASSNYPYAMVLLEEATSIISAGKLSEDILSSWRVPYITGRIHTLCGYSRLESGRFPDAASELYAAMESFGYSFPHSLLSAKFKTIFQRWNLKLTLDIFPQWKIGRAKSYYAQIADQAAECLSIMFTLFKVTGHWTLAELAAVWGLNKSLQSNHDFFSQCVAYANLMETAQHYADLNTSWKIENHAIKMCQIRINGPIGAEELQAIARLYFAIFTSRILRGAITRSLSVGFKTLKICTSVHAVRLKLQMLPLLCRIVLFRLGISEYVSLLTELDYLANEDTDKLGRIWYFSLCVGFQLETGFSYIPYKVSEQYFQEQGESMFFTNRGLDAVKRYYICMWLWCMRNQQWEAATVWEPQIYFPSLMLPEENFTNLVTALYYLEGLLLYKVGKLDVRNFEKVASIYSDISMLVKHISKACKKIKILWPRFLILKAIYRYVRYRDPNAMHTLMQAKTISQKQGNLLDLQWSEHTEKVWRGTIPTIIRDFWVEHSQPGNLLDWHEGLAGNMVMFSFPLPKYGF